MLYSSARGAMTPSVAVVAVHGYRLHHPLTAWYSQGYTLCEWQMPHFWIKEELR